SHRDRPRTGHRPRRARESVRSLLSRRRRRRHRRLRSRPRHRAARDRRARRRDPRGQRSWRRAVGGDRAAARPWLKQRASFTQLYAALTLVNSAAAYAAVDYSSPVVVSARLLLPLVRAIFCPWPVKFASA